MTVEDSLQGLTYNFNGLKPDLGPRSFLQCGPRGLYYTGATLTCLANGEDCEDVDCDCDSSVLKRNASGELWAPPIGCSKVEYGELSGTVSTLLTSDIAPGSSYEADTAELCIPAPESCYPSRGLVRVCSRITVRFLIPEPEEPVEDEPAPEPETPTFWIEVGLKCDGEDIAQPQIYGWSEPIHDGVENMHCYNVNGCCDTGLLEPGEPWKSKFTVCVLNGTQANSTIEVQAWRVAYCVDFVSLPPCEEPEEAAV